MSDAPNRPQFMFPVFAVKKQGGVAVIATLAEGGESFAVPIFNTQQGAVRYADANDGIGLLRIAGGLALVQFLRALPTSVQQVAFNSTPTGVEWSMPIDDLCDAFEAGSFQWDYPVFVIEEGGGCASIKGSIGAGAEVTLLCVFTDDDLADRYAKGNQIDGSRRGIEGAKVFESLLLGRMADGVAFDPTNEDQGR